MVGGESTEVGEGSPIIGRHDPAALDRLASTGPAPPSEAQREAELDRRGLVAVGVPGSRSALAMRGTLPPHRVAVVGARASDPYGLALARQLGRDLALAGFAVVSGGAEGCDHEAHEGALEAGGETVVVLPAGHDHPYPERHVDLFDRASRKGAVVSPFWPTTTIARPRFLSRNTVIAELACAVVVVRARARSGSLSTARAAKALGRPVAAVPGAIGEALSEGCHHLFDDGAVPITSRQGLERWLRRVTGSEVRAMRGRWPTRATGQPAPWPVIVTPFDEGVVERNYALDPAAEAELTMVLERIRAEPGLDLDAMAVRSGLPIGSLVERLLDLELRGLLERMPGGRYRIVGRGV